MRQNHRQPAPRAAIPDAGAIEWYLRQKYRRDFIVTGHMGTSWGSPFERWGAVPVKDGAARAGDEESFTVLRNPAKGYGYSDSFYSAHILGEYRSFADKIVRERFGRYRLFVKTNRRGANPDALVPGVGIGEIHNYIESGDDFRSRIHIVIPDSEAAARDTGEAMAAVCGAFSRARLSAWIRLTCVGEEYFASMSETFEVKPEHISGWRRYFIDGDYRVITPEVSDETGAVACEPLTAEQIERLCALVYLDSLIIHRELGTLGDIVRYMLGFGYGESAAGGKLPCLMTKREWDAVLGGITSDAALCGLRISRYVDVTETSVPSGDVLPGHRAVCFTGGGCAYVVFRGTCGDSEWRDNADGMTQSDTVQQKAAARFVTELRTDSGLNIRSLCVAGHSKGGNKAQYAAIVTDPGFVNRCVSIDGQGFSREFLQKYKNNIAGRKGIIELIAERRDFVSCLGHYIGDTAHYSGRRGEAAAENPYGEPLPYFHCPDALRGSGTGFGAPAAHGAIPGMINRLVVFLLDNPRYRSIRKKTVEDIASLMMIQKTTADEETAEAIKNLAMVFLDITANSRQFDSDIEAVVYEEPDVLIATVEAVTGSGGDGRPDARESLCGLAMAKLAAELMRKPVYLGYMVSFVAKLFALIDKISDDAKCDPKIAGYICGFVEYLLAGVASSAKNAIVKRHISRFLARWRDYLKALPARCENREPGSTSPKAREASAISKDLRSMLRGWANLQRGGLMQLSR